MLALIRIHPVLDRREVPSYFLESVVYHEMLHHHLGGVSDGAGRTVASASWLSLKASFKGDKSEQAAEVGKLLAGSAKQAGIRSCVFDRAGYLYHGRVKALADGAREGGLKF